jgi:PST family polysaccharide transporter
LPPQVSNSAKAIGGMSWMFASSVVSRLATLAGQVVLGWLLLPDDFGAYAFAISITAATAGLRNGGTTQVLIQRGNEEYAATAGLILKFSLCFNLLAMLILLAIGIPMWVSGSASGMILCSMAIAMPLGTPGVLFKAKLTIDGRFQEIAKLTLWSAVLWQASVVCFAMLGWGALSFAIPPLLQAMYENVAGWFYVKQWPSIRQNEGRQRYLDLFRETRWLMLSAAMLAPATAGTYFVVALFNDPATVGVYFFAFQLVVAFSTPIYGAVESVLPSMLVKLESDRSRQLAAYGRALRTALIIALPVATVFALVIPTVMHFTWQAKWDAAAPLAQILTACVPAWILIAIGRSLIEARGWWRMRFVVVALYGIGGMAAAVAGALAGGLQLIAQFVTLYYIGFAVLFLIFLARRLGVAPLSTMRAA